MFYGYRSGAYPITEKALRKLELAENRAFGATEKPMEDLTFRSESQATAVRPSKSLTVEQRLERIELVLERIAESLEAAGKSKQG